MISFLTGKIQDLDEKSMTVLTASGVGYKVSAILNLLLFKTPGEEIELLIHTVVKDDSITLYGFLKKEELSLFEKLITVSGVGPRSALAMLSVLNVENIVLAIESGNPQSLSKVPGIGKRTCEKIIIELKGKLTSFTLNSTGSTNQNTTHENDARLALASLGYNEKDINEVINSLKKEMGEDFFVLETNKIITETLKYLR